MEYKLADTSIAQIVQLIQLGILTGTDISDQMRILSLTVDTDTNKLVPSENFKQTFQNNLESLQTAAEALGADELK